MPMKMKKINKVLIFNDLHLGRKDNSIIHNTDCINYIEWICDIVKKADDIDAIIFQGDWHEHRNSINGLTLHYSNIAAKKLNDLDIPIYFMIGNHDLYYRNNRAIATTEIYDSLDNFIVISEITPREEFGDKGALLVPYLFEKEYPELIQYSNKYPIFFGHFEFKGFVVTGETVKKEEGPDHKDLKKVKRIFSGHFHKRQVEDNVIYVGNTFPMDFSDTNDMERGCAIYTFDNDELKFLNWDDAPSYIKIKLSTLLENTKKILKKKAVVRCIDDLGINYEEASEIRSKLIDRYGLRELTIDDDFDMNSSLDGDSSIDDDLSVQDTNTIIKEKLKTIEVSNINTDKLIEIYDRIK